MASSRRCRKRWRRGTVAGLALCLGLPAAVYAATASGDAVALIESAETAPCVAIGSVSGVRRLDRHGYAAMFAVEQALGGTCSRDSRLQLGWEELATGRASRFADGDRLLVALDTIPRLSLWYERFAAELKRGPVFTPAANGDAFLVLSSTSDSRETAEGVRDYRRNHEAGDDAAQLAALTRIVGATEPRLALAAVARLEAIAGTRHDLPTSVSESLGAIVRDPTRSPALRAALLGVIERSRWAALREPVAAIAVPETDVFAASLRALAALDGGLPQDRVVRLFEHSDPAVRAVAAENAQDADRLDRLPSLLRDDPSARVRSAAAGALVRRRGLDAFASVRPAFADPAPEVRVALADAFAAVGAAAVASLEELFREGTFEEARGAALALDHIGAAGRAALERMAHTAVDERKRNLAAIALGRLDSHTH